MNTRINAVALCAGALALLLAGFAALPNVAIASDDKDKKDIKLTIQTEVKRGEAPLPVTFVVEIDADKDLDQYIYESSYEWVIMGSFILTDFRTGGNPEDPSLRGDTLSNQSLLYNDKHLVAKERKRAPRKKYKEGMEVQRTLQFTHEFKRAGRYFISFRLRNGKYRSQEVKIDVRGDTAFNPYRPPE